jgi:hypothetical protein
MSSQDVLDIDEWDEWSDNDNNNKIQIKELEDISKEKHYPELNILDIDKNGDNNNKTPNKESEDASEKKQNINLPSNLIQKFSKTNQIIANLEISFEEKQEKQKLVNLMEKLYFHILQKPDIAVEEMNLIDKHFSGLLKKIIINIYKNFNAQNMKQEAINQIYDDIKTQIAKDLTASYKEYVVNSNIKDNIATKLSAEGFKFEIKEYAATVKEYVIFVIKWL